MYLDHKGKLLLCWCFKDIAPYCAVNLQWLFKLFLWEVCEHSRLWSSHISLYLYVRPSIPDSEQCYPRDTEWEWAHECYLACSEIPGCWQIGRFTWMKLYLLSKANLCSREIMPPAFLFELNICPYHEAGKNIEVCGRKWNLKCGWSRLQNSWELCDLLPHHTMSTVLWCWEESVP